MKVRYGETSLPYPLHILTGKLLLSGVSVTQIAEFTSAIESEYSTTTPTLQELNLFATQFLLNYNPEVQYNFLTLSRYEELRSRHSGVAPVILVMEGSSATGKSMLTLPLIQQLGATRILSSDSIRQVLRVQYSREEFPELFCHTYQAYRFRQSGPDDLDPAVRGFLAQVEVMEGTLIGAIDRYLQEGTSAIVEGVHILPGSLSHLGSAILEILVHPTEALHRDMFTLKQEASGLRTVSADMHVRQNEFEATRKIQDFMYQQAIQSGVPVIDFQGYESALVEIQRIILQRMAHLVDLHSKR